MKRLKKSNQKNHLRISWYTEFIIMVSVIFLFQNALVYAGESLQETNIAESEVVDVVLTGANEYGSVQLFSYLLTKVDSITKIDPVMMHIKTDSPDVCRVQWKVKLTNGIAPFIGQLSKILNELDPREQNAVLYESPFIVTRGDMEQVKKAKLVITTVDSVVFTIGDSPEGKTGKIISWQDRTVNPWFAMPGAGFE